MRLRDKGDVQRKTAVCDEVCAAPLWAGMRWQALQARLVSTSFIERVRANQELMEGVGSAEQLT